jgi:hypothetical protein
MLSILAVPDCWFNALEFERASLKSFEALTRNERRMEALIIADQERRHEPDDLMAMLITRALAVKTVSWGHGTIRMR